MGDTVSIPDDASASNQHRKPSPPPDKVPVKGEIETTSEDPPKLQTPKIKKKQSKRCPQCRTEGKKRRLTISNRFSCKRCEKDFCTDHIGAHDCDFDHHSHHKKILTEKNPTIHFKKVDKI